MPRAARKKDPKAVYHVTSRSITEFDMFPDNSDKEYFLDILLKLKEKYHCKIYAYCIMDNHYHVIADTRGYDISKFMKSLNQIYVKYINKKYNRRGHLLADRFCSKIIDTNEYLLNVSAYVHNNSKDLPGYRGKEYQYPYSSMGIYLVLREDKRGLVDTDLILSAMNEKNKTRAIKAYAKMVADQKDEERNKLLKEYLESFIKEQFSYTSHREILLRDKKPEEIVEGIAKKLGIENIEEIMHKWKRKSLEFRRIVAYTLAVFCGMGLKEISKFMCNISVSCCANLVNKGFEIIKGNQELKNYILSMAKA